MPPPSGMIPRWMYDQVKFAHSLAMMKSQASAVSAPRPEAAPLTAAITGLGMVCSSDCVWCTRCWRCQPLKAISPVGALHPALHARDVAAGAEALAGAGQHQRLDGLVGGDLFERVDELAAHVVAHRVALVRAVEA